MQIDRPNLSTINCTTAFTKITKLLLDKLTIHFNFNFNVNFTICKIINKILSDGSQMFMVFTRN